MSSKIKRRIFFWILVVFFTNTFPVIIFFALGYRFSLERGIFIYAGSITVKSTPQTTNILVDGKLAPKNKTNFLNNAYHVNGITPGEHTLEISAPGYTTWSKKVSVHSGISTEFWNVLLAKNDYPKNEYASQGTENFFLSPKNDKAALVKNDNESLSVDILDLKTNLSEEIFSSQKSSFPDNPEENIKWSPKEDKLIIPIKKDGQKHYFIVEIESKNAMNLKDIAGTNDLKMVRWDPDEKNTLYYISERDLYQLDTAAPENKISVANSVSGYDISSSYLYYFHLPEGLIYRTNTSNPASSEQITTSALPDISSLSYQITVYDEKRIALLNDENKKFYIYNVGDKDTYFRELSEGVNGSQFSNDGKKLLYFTDRDIFVYFTRDWDVQPTRTENEVRNITRFSGELKNIQWAKDYEHIIFTAGGEIKVIEADYRDHSNLMSVLKLNGSNSRVSSSFPQNKLYFTDMKDGNSYLYSIDFPDKTGFLGIGG